MTTTETVIQQTQKWIKDVVIGLNICPFASKIPAHKNIRYFIADSQKSADIDSDKVTETHLHQLAECFREMNESPDIETCLLIFPDGYQQFEDYLDLLSIAEQLLTELKYSGTYQLASFHPDYLFENSSSQDASNFTNRSPYPMLHILRESSVEKAIASHPDIETIPENNISRLRKLGYPHMQQRLNNIIKEAI